MVVGVLLGLGGVGALSRAASASPTARMAAAIVAGVVIGVIVGVLRGRSWATGSAFFLGLFALWASVSLGLRHDLSAAGTASGIAWALIVMVASVRAGTDA